MYRNLFGRGCKVWRGAFRLWNHFVFVAAQSARRYVHRVSIIDHPRILLLIPAFILSFETITGNINHQLRRGMGKILRRTLPSQLDPHTTKLSHHLCPNTVRKILPQSTIVLEGCGIRSRGERTFLFVGGGTFSIG